jgi:hypothetical protein
MHVPCAVIAVVFPSQIARKNNGTPADIIPIINETGSQSG